MFFCLFVCLFIRLYTCLFDHSFIYSIVFPFVYLFTPLFTCLLLLGHDASFGYIEAVNLTQHETLMARRLGYMASCMFLHKNPDLVGMLLVNSLQKDLSCPDVMRVSIIYY